MIGPPGHYDTRRVCRNFSVCVISGLRREVVANCVFLDCHTASSGNVLPTVRDSPSVPFDPWKWDRWVVQQCRLRNYHSSLRGIPERRSSQLQGSLHWLWHTYFTINQFSELGGCWYVWNTTIFVSVLLGWRHVSATVGHPQVTKMYNEEKLYSVSSGVPRNFVPWGGGVQQIQLRTKERQNGDLGAVAP